MTETVRRNGSRTYAVISPRASNLHLQAVLLACGTHVGCDTGMTVTARESKEPRRELMLDGSPGKQWRVEVLGDTRVEVEFRLLAIFDTGTCT